ncbi:NAD(P)-dependent oxidoreductase [uncultured Eudoraea sp.]|uniref:NAD(P)-dependent oxidoreductase n=1 Tax=uncultured Eudoraea sp. TaxID=1035614 RepID=UPI0026067E32|nr:NAD(P)-binding oxidoreductase [uncultured Eudoraea sp.]
MTTLVVGATGATGKHLVEQLLNFEQKVKVIVRSPEKLPDSWKTNNQLSIIQASISDITEDEMAEYIQDCNAVASCLGHNMNWKGLYGKPRKLVTDAVILLCNAIKKNAPDKPVKIVLMNTSGNRNRDLNEPISIGQRFVIALLRLLLPPHVDNEKAADYLRTKVGQKNNLIEWVAVRPDGLVNEDRVTEYEVYPSPTRSAIFDAGTVSRINVGHFMAKLITENDLWNKWKGQMPVIYKTAQKNS